MWVSTLFISLQHKAVCYILINEDKMVRAFFILLLKKFLSYSCFFVFLVSFFGGLLKRNTKNFHNHPRKFLSTIASYYHQIWNHDMLAHIIEASQTKPIKMNFVESVGNFWLFDFENSYNLVASKFSNNQYAWVNIFALFFCRG